MGNTYYSKKKANAEITVDTLFKQRNSTIIAPKKHYKKG